jgi:hypothetical protein
VIFKLFRNIFDHRFAASESFTAAFPGTLGWKAKKFEKSSKKLRRGRFRLQKITKRHRQAAAWRSFLATLPPNGPPV